MEGADMKFTYDDIVWASEASNPQVPRRKAWIVGIFESRPGPYFDQFPPGPVYTVEFEDGSSTEIHEADLTPWSL
ncbi:hypothetical protein B0E50_06990 [Rhodanobacter sp. C01]|nr:hypothetical protein B0E50_06990 [Rhodanobacter sp. C01]